MYQCLVGTRVTCVLKMCAKIQLDRLNFWDIVATNLRNMVLRKTHLKFWYCSRRALYYLFIYFHNSNIKLDSAKSLCIHILNIINIQKMQKKFDFFRPDTLNTPLRNREVTPSPRSFTWCFLHFNVRNYL